MGTFITCLILVAVLSLVIYTMIKDKKNGKSSCGCECGNCPNSSVCHSDKSKSK